MKKIPVVWVIEEGDYGGVFTVAICSSKMAAKEVIKAIEKERGRPCPRLEVVAILPYTSGREYAEDHGIA